MDAKTDGQCEDNNAYATLSNSTSTKIITMSAEILLWKYNI